MLGKPTLFVNTMKIMNQNYFKFENKPYEIELREKIGFIYNVNELKNIVDKINSPNFINEFKSKLKNIEYYRNLMFLWNSSQIAAENIIKILDGKWKKF